MRLLPLLLLLMSRLLPRLQPATSFQPLQPHTPDRNGRVLVAVTPIDPTNPADVALAFSVVRSLQATDPRSYLNRCLQLDSVAGCGQEDA